MSNALNSACILVGYPTTIFTPVMHFSVCGPTKLVRIAQVGAFLTCKFW